MTSSGLTRQMFALWRPWSDLRRTVADMSHLFAFSRVRGVLTLGPRGAPELGRGGLGFETVGRIRQGTHMKKLLGTVAILAAALPLAANAADLPPAPPSYKAPVVAPLPVYNWTGCYVGGHVGGAWSHLDITDVGNAAGFAFATAGVAGQTFSPGNKTAFFGGGQAGCNYQVGQVVFGIEGDLGWMDLKQSVLDPGTVSNTMVGINSGLYGDITGRLGFAAGPALLYVKGGGAFFNGKETFTTNSAAFISNTDVSTFTGWVAGGGIEYLFAPSWTVKAEYLHFDFGAQTFNVLATGGTFPFTEKLRVDTVKVGVNYLFNAGGPVMARY
jgi:outer membrane immunogenic protein